MIERLVDRLRYRPGQHRPRVLRAGVVAIVLVALISYCALTLSIPLISGSGQMVTMRLADAADARSGQPVRVGGVDVGRVASVEPDPSRGGARLELEVDSEVSLRSDASASLSWRTMFGRNLYVDLNPGSPGAPPLSGEIPASRTTSPVEFDELLRPLDASGRRAVRTVLAEADAALARPAEPGGALEALPSTAGSADPALRALRGSDPGDVGRVIRGVSGTAEALGRSEADLAGLIDGAEMTLAVTAARRADLSALLAEAPATLESTAAEMVRLRGTLDRLDPLVAELRPGVAAMPRALARANPAVRELRALLVDLRPALSDLNPALDRVGSLSGEGLPLIEGLRPSVRRTRDEIIPWLDRDNGAGLSNYAAIGPWLAAAASASGEFDANGYMWRYQTAGGEGTLNPTACQFTSAGPREDACRQLLEALFQLTGAGAVTTEGGG